MNGRILSRHICFAVTIFLVVLFNHVLANDVFWKIKNINASSSRVKEVSATLTQCQSGIKPYFDQIPAPLTIYLYGTRSSFVQGLQNVLGFSREGAAYFKESSAPRPMGDNYLVPPDQDSRNVCHEIIHHYLESNTNREHLLHGKWFDEGTASILANRIFNPQKFEGMRRYLIEQSHGHYAPIDKMQTEKDWNALHQQKEWRNISYLQAMFMVDYFFTRYSVGDFKHLLIEMNDKSFDKAFRRICKGSQKRFYRRWKKQFIK